MHSLETISRLNADAFGPDIAALQRKGKHVVATYSGTALMSIESFDHVAPAIDAAHAEPSSPDQSFRLFVAKYEEPNNLVRDQSEDRASA